MSSFRMMKKGFAFGISLAFIGFLLSPFLDFTIDTTAANRVGVSTDDVHYFVNMNETIYRLCFVESGDVQHRNFAGRFFGIPVHNNNDIRHFGVGSFGLDLLGWNKSSDVRLKITRLYTITEYHQDVRISLKGFIGFYQPTGHLSEGTLFGFVCSIKIQPLPLND